VYRVTVGGVKVTPFNDSLWRTWIPCLHLFLTIFSFHTICFPLICCLIGIWIANLNCRWIPMYVCCIMKLKWFQAYLNFLFQSAITYRRFPLFALKTWSQIWLWTSLMSKGICLGSYQDRGKKLGLWLRV